MGVAEALMKMLVLVVSARRRRGWENRQNPLKCVSEEGCVELFVH